MTPLWLYRPPAQSRVKRRSTICRHGRLRTTLDSIETRQKRSYSHQAESECCHRHVRVLSAWVVYESGALKSRDLTKRHHIARVDIARPDKTAPDQTARLNNGDREQSNPWRRITAEYKSQKRQLTHRNTWLSRNVKPSEDQQEPVPVATTSTTSDSTTAAEGTASDDFCEVCFVAPRGGFALVPCGHARFYLSITI